MYIDRDARAQMITTAVAVSTDNAVLLGAGPTYGILLAILLVHGIMCSAATRVLARINLFYGFVIAGATVAAIVALLVCSGDSKASTRTAFLSYENNTGWKNDGWAFLLSFAAPMWTITIHTPQTTPRRTSPRRSRAFDGCRRAAELAVTDLEKGKNGMDMGAVRSELVLAIYEVGQSFYRGWGVEKDKEMGVQYFRVAARLVGLRDCEERKGDGGDERELKTHHCCECWAMSFVCRARKERDG
ncbi:hypothetical protein NUW54_g12695 [Trametes sanguinea]|uniref:Uncharacterized protein n=1 Tax=Trametes sanguinea TaxID=158606 RepID=A0ACC1MVC2_9APHY|nr:hypothetical protein NUW54_g12695 [Trametes sanguinea]